MKLLNNIDGPSLTFWADMGNHLWQSTLFGVFIVLIILLLKKASANTRYIVGWIGLIKFILPSAFLYQAVQSLQLSFLSKGFWNMEALMPLNRHLAEPLFLFNKSNALSLEPVSVVGVSSFSGIILLNIIGFVWLAGTLFQFFRWQYRLNNLKRELLNYSHAAPESLQNILGQLRQKIGLKKNVNALLVDRKVEPGVLGIFTPRIILPTYLYKNLSASELEPILIHELAHVKRQDNLWGFMQMLLYCFLWFNPLIWWLNRRLTWESERSCDEEVLIQSNDKNNYAKGIIIVSHYCIGLKIPGFSGINDVGLENRLESIISFNGNKLSNRYTQRFIIFTVSIFLLLTTSASGFLAHMEAISTQDGERYDNEFTSAESDSIAEAIYNYTGAIIPAEPAIKESMNTDDDYKINLMSDTKGERLNTFINYEEASKVKVYPAEESVHQERIEKGAHHTVSKTETNPFRAQSAVSTLNKFFSPLQVPQTVANKENIQSYQTVVRSYRENQSENDKEYYSQLQVLNQVKPVFPEAVLHLGITEGFAEVVLIVNERGEQRDMIVSVASHKQFGSASVAAIQKWNFIPLQVDGKAQTSRVKVNVDFEYIGVGQPKYPSIIEEAALRFERDGLFDNISNLGQLDHEPRLIKDVRPVYPENLKKSEKSGMVVVEFFIDPAGNVKAPGIKMATDDEFAISALAAIKEWKFEPPLKRGRPTYARVYQRFSYNHIPVNF